MVFDASCPIGTGGAQLVVVDRGMQADLGDARRELEQDSFHAALRARRAHHDPIREHRALFGGETTEREAGDALTFAVTEPHREAELHRELEEHVEEIGSLLEGAEVAGARG